MFMKNVLNCMPLVLIMLLLMGCEDDPPTPCPNIMSTDGEIEINEEKLLFQMAEVRPNATPTLDTYEFLIEAIGSNCNKIQKFRFYTSVPINEKLEGEFSVIESIRYTKYQITSLTYTLETLDPRGFDIKYAVSGECKLKTHNEKEYSVEMEAVLKSGQMVNCNFRYQF